MSEAIGREGANGGPQRHADATTAADGGSGRPEAQRGTEGVSVWTYDADGRLREANPADHLIYINPPPGSEGHVALWTDDRHRGGELRFERIEQEGA